MSVVTATELEARHAALAADCLSKGKASQSSLTRQEALSPIVRYIPTTKTVERMQRRQLAAAQKALEDSPPLVLMCQRPLCGGSGGLSCKVNYCRPLLPRAHIVVRPSWVVAAIVVHTSSGSMRNVCSLSNVTRPGVAPIFASMVAANSPRKEGSIDGTASHEWSLPSMPLALTDAVGGKLASLGHRHHRSAHPPSHESRGNDLPSGR